MPADRLTATFAALATPRAVADWVEPYRRFWEERLDRLENYLRKTQSQEKKHGRKKKKLP